jgi:hypothetical protein
MIARTACCVVVVVVAFAGCFAGSADQRESPEDRTIVVTDPRVSNDGTSLTVTGLVDGIEASVAATEVTVDGVAVPGPVLNVDCQQECWLCDCSEKDCSCTPVPCCPLR